MDIMHEVPFSPLQVHRLITLYKNAFNILMIFPLKIFYCLDFGKDKKPYSHKDCIIPDDYSAWHWVTIPAPKIFYNKVKAGG